jgi:hypothetical protein
MTLGTLINEYGELMEWWLAVPAESMLQLLFLFTAVRTWTNLGLNPSEKPEPNRQSYGTGGYPVFLIYHV